MSGLIPIKHKNQRILTTEQLAEVYETDVNNIRNNFNNNKEKFTEGKHYYLLQGSELKDFKNYINEIDVVDKHTKSLYLWTERGASRHCKILDTDKAWEQFDNLEETYFNVKENKSAVPTNFAQALRLAAEQAERIESLQLEVNKREQLIGELKPSADYTDKILKSKGTMNINAIAKDYGMSGAAMNKKLHELGVQYYQDKQWLLYRKYQDKGYTHSSTIEFEHKDGTPDTRLHTKWTQKGRLFLYNLLKENGVLPMIERPVKKEA